LWSFKINDFYFGDDVIEYLELLKQTLDGSESEGTLESEVTENLNIKDTHTVRDMAIKRSLESEEPKTEEVQYKEKESNVTVFENPEEQVRRYLLPLPMIHLCQHLSVGPEEVLLALLPVFKLLKIPTAGIRSLLR
jgi:hypothetical protein